VPNARAWTRPRWRKTLGVASFASVLTLGGFWGERYYRAHHAPAPRFETAELGRGRLVARVTATGTLSALVTVLVGSQVSGRIALLSADYNSVVKKGQVVAQIAPELFRAALEQARANSLSAKGDLAKAKALAEDAKRSAKRSQELFDRKLIAEAERDTATANADVTTAQVLSAQGQVAQAEAALHQAEVNLSYCTIRAPIDGVVISRSVDVGQTVAASLTAPTIFTIAEDLKKMQVDTNVAEADVGKLQAGMTATFTVDAYPNERFQGTVRQIRNAPLATQNVVTYDAVIDVDNNALKLKPGMTANVTFVYADRPDVVSVPNSALRFKPPADLLRDSLRTQANAASSEPVAPVNGAAKERPLDQRSIWVLRASMPERREIRVGVTDGTSSELLEGSVRPGDLVITGFVGEPAQPAAQGLLGMRRLF